MLKGKVSDAHHAVPSHIFLAGFLATAVLVLLYMAASASAPALGEIIDESWFVYWWLAPVAVLLSVTANVAGISGAALFVPFFLLVFPFFAEPLHGLEAVRIAIVNEVFGLTSSSIAFWRFGLIDGKLALGGFLLAAPTVFLGTVAATLFSEAVLLLVVSAFLLASVALLWFEEHLAHHRRSQHGRTHVSTAHGARRGECIDTETRAGVRFRYHRRAGGYWWRRAAFMVGGFFQGATGFGVGEAGVVGMIVTRIPVRVAIGTIHVIIAGTALLAAIVHIGLVQSAAAFPWNVLIMTAPAAVLGGQLAPYVTARVSARFLERFVSFLFIMIAFALVALALT